MPVPIVPDPYQPVPNPDDEPVPVPHDDIMLLLSDVYSRLGKMEQKQTLQGKDIGTLLSKVDKIGPTTDYRQFYYFDSIMLAMIASILFAMLVTRVFKR